jgi:hypothetical protein
MNDYPEPDEVREEALRAAAQDFASAVRRGDATEDELIAAIEAVRQVPIDLDRMMNALHVPPDAGEYEGALRALLERIPDGWGRWIRCGPGWYPILAELEGRLREIDPDYRVLQVKEKFGTLRFYWSGRSREAGDEAVRDAELASTHTCELCGARGKLRVRRSWLRTVCDSCARYEGYEDLPDEEDD